MNKNILFTGGGGIGNELIWKILNNKYNLFFCDNLVENVDPIIPKKKVFRISKVNTKNYINEIKKLCKTHNIDLIVPGIDEELLKLSKNKNVLPELFLPNYETIYTCNNKWRFYNFCLKNELDVPLTSLAKNFNKNKHSKKIILKPIYGRGSKGIFISNNLDETKVLLKLLRKKKLLENYIVQDFIKGSEYTVTCCNLHGFSYIFPLNVLEKKGITIKAIYKKETKLLNEIDKLNNILNHQKIFNVQLIKTQKKFFLLEINPRVSTTFCLLLKNKFDPFTSQKIKKLNVTFKKLNRYYRNIV